MGLLPRRKSLVKNDASAERSSAVYAFLGIPFPSGTERLAPGVAIVDAMLGEVSVENNTRAMLIACLGESISKQNNKQAVHDLTKVKEEYNTALLFPSVYANDVTFRSNARKHASEVDKLLQLDSFAHDVLPLLREGFMTHAIRFKNWVCPDRNVEPGREVIHMSDVDTDHRKPNSLFASMGVEDDDELYQTDDGLDDQENVVSFHNKQNEGPKIIQQGGLSGGKGPQQPTSRGSVPKFITNAQQAIKYVIFDTADALRHLKSLHAIRESKTDDILSPADRLAKGVSSVALGFQSDLVLRAKSGLDTFGLMNGSDVNDQEVLEFGGLFTTMQAIVQGSPSASSSYSELTKVVDFVNQFDPRSQAGIFGAILKDTNARNSSRGSDEARLSAFTFTAPETSEQFTIHVDVRLLADEVALGLAEGFAYEGLLQIGHMLKISADNARRSFGTAFNATDCEVALERLEGVADHTLKRVETKSTSAEQLGFYEHILRDIDRASSSVATSALEIASSSPLFLKVIQHQDGVVAGLLSEATTYLSRVLTSVVNTITGNPNKSQQ